MFWWYLIFTFFGIFAALFTFGSVIVNTPANGLHRTERLLRDTNIDIIVFGVFFLILGYENTQLFMWFLTCKFATLIYWYDKDIEAPNSHDYD